MDLSLTSGLPVCVLIMPFMGAAVLDCPARCHGPMNQSLTGWCRCISAMVHVSYDGCAGVLDTNTLTVQ